MFSGSLDGHIRGYTATDGRVVWDFDTGREFETVNGVKARGGAVDGPGVVIANGLLLVNSGYMRARRRPRQRAARLRASAVVLTIPMPDRVLP